MGLWRKFRKNRLIRLCQEYPPFPGGSESRVFALIHRHAKERICSGPKTLCDICDIVTDSYNPLLAGLQDFYKVISVICDSL